MLKIKMIEGYKKVFTVEEMVIAKRIISELKEENMTNEEYGRIIVNYYLSMRYTDDFLDEVISAKMEVCKNRRCWERYGDDSRDIDIYVTAKALTVKGYIEVGCYLSDVWDFNPESNDVTEFFVKYCRMVTSGLDWA